MKDLARAVARRLGYDLVPLRKLKEPHRQLAACLQKMRVDMVLDVGANRGQYATMLRDGGWRGPIVSFEPLPAEHAALQAAARKDAAWQVAPAMALGARTGEIFLERSAESDMSSTLPQSTLLKNLSPSSAIVERLAVDERRLDEVEPVRDGIWQRMFLKIDVQGAEYRVLEGARGIWDRIAGLQLELSLVPLYDGEEDWRTVLDNLTGRGFSPYLIIPGYFERKLARQVQMDVVLFRESLDTADCPPGPGEMSDG